MCTGVTSVAVEEPYPPNKISPNEESDEDAIRPSRRKKSKSIEQARLFLRYDSSVYRNFVRDRPTDFNDVYEVVEIIGDGSISVISKIKRRESAIGGSSHADLNPKDRPVEYLALKEIDLSLVDRRYLDELRNEVEMLKSLDHPNIIKAYETFHVKKRLAIVMELCSGGDLYTRHP
jgi:serine/threonine protein kinase